MSKRILEGREEDNCSTLPAHNDIVEECVSSVCDDELKEEENAVKKEPLEVKDLLPSSSSPPLAPASSVIPVKQEEEVFCSKSEEHLSLEQEEVRDESANRVVSATEGPKIVKEEKDSIEKEGIRGNEAKKDHPENASRVIHISSIPHSVTDQKIALIGLSFGEVSCILFLKNKGQAFIDFERIEDAARMVSFFQRHAALVNGNRLHVQFSNHKQLSLSQMSRSVARTQIALKNAKILRGAAEVGGKNTVLRLLIHDMVMGVCATITHDTLYQVYSKYGQVLKIVLGKRTATNVLAFVQMIDVESASNALRDTNNRCLFGGGFCQCNVEIARSPSLVVKLNNGRTRDYTNPCLLPLTASSSSSMVNWRNNEETSNVDAPATHIDMSDDAVEYMPEEQQQSTPPLSSSNNDNNEFVHQQQLDDPTLSFGFDTLIAASAAPPEDDHAAAAAAAAMMYAAAANARPLIPSSTMQCQQQQFMGGTPINPFGIRSALACAAAFFDTANNPEMMHLQQHPPMFTQQQNQMMHHQQQQQQQQQQRTQRRVLLVSNLNEEKVNPDNLFILFGVYGDVKRVRILFNKKDTALIQFNTAEQAVIALKYLDGVPIFGKKMKISFSKHLSVQRVKEGVDNPELTKDFEESSLHRFKKPGSKNYMNIFSPNASLHLSNISDDMSEEDIKSLFSQYGTVIRFRFFEHDKHMAAISMDSIENACHALMACHNYVMPKGRFLRVSFSKPR